MRNTCRMTTPRLITTTEAAERLGIPVRTVQWNAMQGNLPHALKLPGNGSYLFDPAAVDAFKTRHAAGSRRIQEVQPTE